MTTRSRLLRSFPLAAALASVLCLSASAKLTKEQVQWFMNQPENKKIFDSDLSADEKLERLSNLPGNSEKFGPDVHAEFLRMMSKHADSTTAAEADNADHAADPGTDNKAVMGNGAKRRAARVSGGKSAQAERRPQKKAAGVKTQKQTDAAEEESRPAAEPGVDANAAQALGGAGVSRGRESRIAGVNRSTSGGSGGGGGAAASPAAAPPKSPAASNQILSVVCGPTKNVVTWKLVANRNSNSVLRSVDGATSDWVCGGPAGIAPCTNLDVNTFTDTNVSPGKTYAYRQKSAPSCASNTVTCPGGASTGESCTTGGPVVTGGSGGGGSGGTGGTDTSCTGGNPKCICVKNVGGYGRYEDAAREATAAAFPGQGSKPAGMSDAAASAKICAAYAANMTFGVGSDCRPQGDEIVFEDPHAPNGRYPTVSVDVITSAGGFWANSVAACEPGVQ